jgi:hypothetical protein
MLFSLSSSGFPKHEVSYLLLRWMYIGPRSKRLGGYHANPRPANAVKQARVFLVGFPPIRMLWEQVDCEKGKEARERPEAQRSTPGVGLKDWCIDFVSIRSCAGKTNCTRFY